MKKTRRKSQKLIPLFSFPFHRIENERIYAFEAALVYDPGASLDDRFVVCHVGKSEEVEWISRRGSFSGGLLDFVTYLEAGTLTHRSFHPNRLLRVDHFDLKRWADDALEIALQIPQINIFQAKERMEALDSFKPIQSQSQALRETFHQVMEHPKENCMSTLLSKVSKNAFGLYGLDLMDQEKPGWSDVLDLTLNALIERGAIGDLREGHRALTVLNQDLCIAITNGHAQEIQRLMELGFRIFTPEPGDFDIDIFPLCAALKTGNTNLADQLLALDQQGCADYFCSFRSYNEIIDEQMVSYAIQLALTYGARLEDATAWWGALYCDVDNERIASFIRRTGLDINSPPGMRQSLLGIAGEYGMSNRFEMLLSLGADPDFKDQRDRNAWDYIERRAEKGIAVRSALEAAVLRAKTPPRDGQSTDCSIGL